MPDATPGEQAEQQFLEAVRQSQQAVVDAVGSWAKGFESLSASYPPVPEDYEPPTPEQVVERSFDFAEKLLASQREFARNVLAAAAPAFRQPGEAAEGAGESKEG
jgi:hypothetical protein